MKRLTTPVLAIIVATCAAYGVSVLAQSASPSASKPPAAGAANVGAVKTEATAPAKAGPFKIPRTPDGQPDLQGFWTNATLTPLQRPNNVTTEYVTRDDFEKRVAQRAATDEEQTTPGTVADVHYDFTQFGLDKTQSRISSNGYRTSLIIDPPDGKIPPQTPEGTQRNQAIAAARRAQGAATDRIQNQGVGQRCIIMGGAGPPLMDAGYNANYQIVQSRENVALLTEMIHDVRLIPLDNRPAPPEGYKGWMGYSRGRWEGDTLVIETTNFNGRNPFQGSSDKLKVTERLTRISPDQIQYRFTVEDPATWARPWTAEEILVKTDGPIFEHACHEGNYGVYNTLAGARREEALGIAPAAPAGRGGRGGAGPGGPGGGRGGRQGGGRQGGGPGAQGAPAAPAAPETP
jgi:hypothetical protein